MPSPHNRILLNASWLIKLRWVAVIGQVLTIATVVIGFKIQLPALWALITVIAVTALSNLILAIWFRRQLNSNDYGDALQHPQSNIILGLVMVMDMMSLTTLLFSTGGPNNPFLLFFFVNLSLCALVLNRNWAWGLNLLSVVCFAGLMYDHHQLEQLDLGSAMWPIRDRGNVSLEQMGLLVAFATCTSVIVYFMTRLTDELSKQQAEVRKAQAQKARSEKLEALGTLAAGTAHELATPLSTIAVVARDVEHAFDQHPPDFPGAEDVIEDIHLIRSQLDRCRSILDRMAGHAGQSIGETTQVVPITGLVDAVLKDLDDSQRVRFDLPKAIANKKIAVPLFGLSQALRGLIQNGLDSDPVGPVMITIQLIDKNWVWNIKDSGHGMSPDVLRRVSEPFFTTKEPGKGMGLGVFLATSVVERIGGKIRFQSRPNEGSKVTIHLPAFDENPQLE